MCMWCIYSAGHDSNVASELAEDTFVCYSFTTAYGVVSYAIADQAGKLQCIKTAVDSFEAYISAHNGRL